MTIPAFRDGDRQKFIPVPLSNWSDADLAAANERIRTLEDHIHQVRLAWNRVGRCEDEFLPEQPGACSEVRDLFDAAVSALLLHAEGIRPLPQAIESEVKS